MAAPQKPWENIGANYRVAPAGQTTHGFSRAPIPSTTVPGLPTQTIRQPPPIPNRAYRQQSSLPTTSSTYPSYGTYGSYGGYSGYSGLSGYGSYGSYGGYGGYGNTYGYGGYGVNRYGGYLPRPELESRFIRLAEESTRPAFQSIESLVQAFSSVTFMLESTFSAIHNSFRAVLSVAENMGRLRSVFGQFFSVFAIFRAIKWLYKKCLYLLGVLKSDPSQEEAWRTAQSPEGAAPGQSRLSWPVLMLTGIMLSGPYLMWKLLSSLSATVSSNSFSFSEWKKSKNPVTLAVAEFNFKAESEEELSIRAGDRVVVAPAEFQGHNVNQSGWVLATVDGQKAGFVPLSYLRLTGKMHYNRAVPHSQPQSLQTAVAGAYPEAGVSPVSSETAKQQSSDGMSIPVAQVASQVSNVNEKNLSSPEHTELKQ